MQEHIIDNPPAKMFGIFLSLIFLLVVRGSTKPDYTGSSITDTEKTILNIALAEQMDFLKLAFSDCNPLKKDLGLDYNQLVHRKPDFSHVTIDLWINQTQQQRIPIIGSSSEILSSPNFKKGFPIIIFMHGFRDSLASKSVQTMGKTLVQKEGLNVFTVDSSSLIESFYLRATTNVRFIGEILGQILTEFYNNGIGASSIHLIGHSLGAHMAGFAAKTFKESTGLKVARITGLDAAGPCFYRENSSLRLARTDADYVDVIHTCSGVYGLGSQIGDADFYPNGGREQPGCLIPSCSHSRSWDFFAESILRPEGFLAVSCSSWENFRGNCQRNDNRRVLMGYGATNETKGKFYLKTAAEPSFGLKEQGTFWK